jgi:hypothetical protein
MQVYPAVALHVRFDRTPGRALPGHRMTVNADLSLHPDGTDVAYTQGVFATEIWIMEGFLAR